MNVEIRKEENKTLMSVSYTVSAEIVFCAFWNWKRYNEVLVKLI